MAQRPATNPIPGGARDALMGALAMALAGWMQAQGAPDEVAVLTGGFAMGLMTWGRKQLLGRLSDKS